MRQAEVRYISGPMSTVFSAVELADIEVVLVTYRSTDHVRALLDLWPGELAVTVVDNSGPDPVLAELMASREHGDYICGGGQGFARAANLGARCASRDYLVFVNPDSRPTGQDLLALVTGLAADQSAAAHGGTLVDSSGGAEIGSGGWEPSIRRTAVHATGLHKRLPTAGLFAQPARGRPVDVDWVCGGCLAVRARQFVELGGFDEAFFVYSEDVSFGRRVRAAGLESVLRPDVLIPHAAGSSGLPRARCCGCAGHPLPATSGAITRPPGPRSCADCSRSACCSAPSGMASSATGPRPDCSWR